MFNTLYNKLNNLANETKAAFYEGLEEDIDPKILAALKVLMLDTTARFEHIKEQYKRLSKEYHPDSGHHSSSEKFLEIKSAYDVLKSHFKNKESL